MVSRHGWGVAMSIEDRRRKLVGKELADLREKMLYEFSETLENILLIMEVSYGVELEERYSNKFPSEELCRN